MRIEITIEADDTDAPVTQAIARRAVEHAEALASAVNSVSRIRDVVVEIDERDATEIANDGD